MAAAKWYTCHDDVKELAATAPFLELGASMFLAGRVKWCVQEPNAPEEGG